MLNLNLILKYRVTSLSAQIIFINDILLLQRVKAPEIKDYILLSRQACNTRHYSKKYYCDLAPLTTFCSGKLRILASRSSSRSLVVGPSLRPFFRGLCKKDIFRSYLPTYLPTVVTVGTVVTEVIVVTVLTAVTVVTKKLFPPNTFFVY